MLNQTDGERGRSRSSDAAGAAAAPAPKTSLLIIEDDENISTAIEEYFSRAGYAVNTAPDGIAGIEAAVKNRPDVVVLDLMLPKMDGLAVCKELRQKNPQMPILMLTAKDDVVDKVLGLEMGADDYITKPFSLREVEARIKSVLRRVRAATATGDGKDETPIVRGNLRLDPVRREVMIAERQIELTPKEIDLLRSGITPTRDMTGRLILTLTACEQRSKRILTTPSWY